MVWLAIAVGGALGSVARHGVNVLIHGRWPVARFPFATLIVNVAGCLIIGLLAGLLISERIALRFYWREFLFVGILGGSAGTTHDAFKLIEEAQKHGARVALFGRKIKEAEHPIEFIRHLRRITDGHLGAKEAVKSYHATLAGLGVAPRRSLQEDLALTANELSYAR